MNVVFIYYANNLTPAYVEHEISEIRRMLPGKVSEFNVGSEKGLSTFVEYLDKADVYLIHNTASYSFDFLRELLVKLKQVSETAGIVIIKQDEHVSPFQFDKLFSDFEVSSVLSTVSDQDIPLVYPNSYSSGVNFHHIYCAYLTRTLTSISPRPRPKYKKLTYRGSIQPHTLGRLGFDKVLMPKRLKNIGIKDSDWAFDFSSNAQSRLFGNEWLDFLSNSFAIATSESGSNLFDLDGSLSKNLEKHYEQYGVPDWDDDLALKLLEEKVLSLYEGNVNYGQIAPRHLESIVSLRPQIAISGDYSGLLVDKESAIFVRSDLSDLEDALRFLEDDANYESIVSVAKEKLFSEKRFRFTAFEDCLQEALISATNISKKSASDIEEQSSFPHISQETVQALVLTPGLHERDPRHNWWVKSLIAMNFKVSLLQFDSSHQGTDNKLPLLTIKKEPETEFELFTLTFSENGLDFTLQLSNEWVDDPEGRILLLRLIQLSQSTENTTSSWLARLFLRNLEAIRSSQVAFSIDMVVANDLQTAFAAVLIWSKTNTTIIYDNQEVFTAQFDYLDEPWAENDKILWDEMERYVFQKASTTYVVSPGIQHYYKDKWGLESSVIPNFAPLDESVNSHKIPGVNFVFFGGAAVNRGLELLIDNWDFPSEIATLTFYCPASTYVEQLKLRATAKQTVQKEISINFEEPVHESELISEMSKYQVGLIPYEYKYPYNHCSPNKLGQYIAAGLPVLSNDQAFIADVVSEFNIGLIFSWNNIGSFSKAVEYISVPNNLLKYQHQTKKAFLNSLNWEKYAIPQIQELVVADKQTSATNFSSVLQKIKIRDSNPLEAVLLRELSEYSVDELRIPIGYPAEDREQNSKQFNLEARKKLLASVFKKTLEFALTYKFVQLASKRVQSLPIVGTKLNKFKETTLRFW